MERSGEERALTRACWRRMVGVFALALVLRWGATAWFLPQFKPDLNLDQYRSLARTLASGEGFICGGEAAGSPYIRRTPGYSFYLAGLILLFGDRLDIFLYSQGILGALSAALSIPLARRWLSWRPSILVGVLVALDPQSILRCADLRSDTLFTVLFLCGLLHLVWREDRASAWLFCGVWWGAATLCRPISMFLWGPALLYALLRRLGWRSPILFVVGFASLTLPWMARNAYHTGHFFLGMIGEENLLAYRAAGVLARQGGREFDEVRDEIYSRYGSFACFQGREEFEKKREAYRAEARRILLGSPGVVFRQFLEGIGRILVGPGLNAFDSSLKNPRPFSGIWPMIYVGVMGVVCLFAAFGAYLLRWKGYWPVILILYFTLLAAGPEGSSRFRLPITPLMVVLALSSQPLIERVWRRGQGSGTALSG